MAARLCAFCSVSPVQKCSASSSQTATSGVECGRPSARTVVTQNSSAFSITCCVAGHATASAPGSLKRSSSEVFGVMEG